MRLVDNSDSSNWTIQFRLSPPFPVRRAFFEVSLSLFLTFLFFTIANCNVMLQQPKKRPSKMSLSTGVKTAADFDTSPLAVTYFVHASIARGIMKQIRVHILCTLIFYMHIFLNEKHPISGMLFYQNTLVDDITAALHPRAPYRWITWSSSWRQAWLQFSRPSVIWCVNRVKRRSPKQMSLMF